LAAWQPTDPIWHLFLLVIIEVIQIGKTYFSERIEIPNNCTAKDAIQNYLPKRTLQLLAPDFSLGIWGVNLDGRILPKPENYRLKAQDRLEIYYPLKCDPKKNRKIKAQNQALGQ